ncbi:MAG TPA: choice-of-anchor D domain-containing protein, partial [Candidatus Kapabacteria bacterium]|nr:choice-of-anchor D domain-containing protein [Candidatus Kapabacteria bacterium]
GAVKATVCISPINPQQDASATVVIKDKTGKTTRLPFTYYAERVDVDKTVLNFGLMTPGTPGTLSFLITNPLGRAVIIEKAGLVNRNPAFTVKSPTVFPITLAPGDSIRVVVEANPARPDQTYNDTVFVKTTCAEIKIPVLAETGDPCVQIGDLDFGTLEVGQTAARPLRISNDGAGIVTFSNPSGGDVLEWVQSMFTVSAKDLARLAAVRLARGEFVDVTVTFTATQSGMIRDTARLWASVRTCRDISYWVARVGEPVSAPIELTSTTHLEAIHPNPTDGATTIRFALARPGHATIKLYDDRGARIATLLNAERDAGTHTVVVDAAALAPGIYHVRLDVDGAGFSRAFVRR